jgi:sortase A
MLRALSSLLIVGGLFIAGLGLHSVWETRQAEELAREQWDRQIAARPAASAMAPRRGDLLAKLSIGTQQWVVVEGANPAELQRGPGHLADSALPGSRGNCVIAGHRDTQFRVLRNVEIGEKISLEAGGRTFVYRVMDRKVVAPTDTSSLDPTAKPTLTLVTCYPFYYVGPAPKRFVIRAELISESGGSRG